MNPLPMILGLLILWGLALVMLVRPRTFRLAPGITRAIGVVLLLASAVYLAGALS
ncbi:hypothetical protein PQ455_07960 [Sphingomonas naphthae]|uniref:DUF3309 family protein n=1 Tax=Sphingomonas naphthae TaxID=1813468 RepID=A0ABY7TPG9_9SPHN|nr:hypothetical protein [Sphingomonas naphthae]WCT75138.1 hypothetical protein PQ455_07960 [Sphingomonas naphthae]